MMQTNEIEAIKTLLATQLTLAENNTDVTTANPSTGAGLDDLGKAKAFVRSASLLLLTTLQQYDDQSFLDTLQSKVTSMQALTDGDSMMPDAISAAIAILAAGVDADQTSHEIGRASCRERVSSPV